MGLIKAISGAFRSEMADQWKEYFICSSMPTDILVMKGKKNITNSNYKSSNTKASEDIITKGSIVAVNEGQAMIVVDNGKIVDFTCESGVYTFETTGEPSMFYGPFGKGLIDSFRRAGERIGFGGGTYTSLSVYYINLKEIIGNHFRSNEPMPYDDPFYKTVLYLNYSGTYSYKIVDPIVFFSTISGNVEEKYSASNLFQQINNEFYASIDTAMSSLANDNIKFSLLPSKQKELSSYMKIALSEDWRALRGIEMVSVGVSSITPDAKSRERIETFDNSMMIGNSDNAIKGRLTDAQATAFENMGKNENGTNSMDMLGVGLGMMGINMVNNMNESAKTTWECKNCNTKNTGSFCQHCGQKRE